MSLKGCWGVSAGVLGCVVLAAASPAAPPQVSVVGPWAVEVGPGAVEVAGQQVALADAATLAVPPAERVQVVDEAHDQLPVYDPAQPGWRRGKVLQGVATQETSAPDRLYPDSVIVKGDPGQGLRFSAGSDFIVDARWGTVGRVEGGDIVSGQPVYIDYAYSPDRVDTVAISAEGVVRLAAGTPGVGAITPPPIGPDEAVLARIYVPGGSESLSPELLFPVDPAYQPLVPEPVAERLLPNTVKKLRAGEPLRIVAWGDSVTVGGGVDAAAGERWQEQFAKGLRERFPGAQIEVLTAAWGGANSRMFMETEADAEHNFNRDVLDVQPDLVVMEFVNDAYLNAEQTREHYADILTRLRSNGIELIVLTPHLVWPGWLGVDTLKLEEDPRPYVKGLREFAAANDVALADAAERWVNLWREGLPYTTLLANSLNHPDARGHRIFAEELLALFPAAQAPPQ